MFCNRQVLKTSQDSKTYTSYTFNCYKVQRKQKTLPYQQVQDFNITVVQ